VKLPNFSVLLLLLLTACATAPSVQPCPRLPALEMLGEDVLGPSFTDRIASFLSGKIPEQKPSGSP